MFRVVFFGDTQEVDVISHRCWEDGRQRPNDELLGSAWWPPRNSRDLSLKRHRGPNPSTWSRQPAKHVYNRCGLSSWAVGRNNSEKLPSKRSQDVTGLIVATCRHSVILAGCNMYRGESYAYSHYIHQSRFPDVKYYASDIVCKYWPWAQRVSRRWPEYDIHGSEPFLSVMHATGHAYYCQITFDGFWREGSGWSVMETTEIANAFLSRACNTTKYMTAA